MSKSRLVFLLILADIVVVLISWSAMNGRAGELPNGVAFISEDCVACGLCWEMCPDTFMECRDRGAIFVNPVGKCLTCTAESSADLQEVMDACPAEAIQWTKNGKCGTCYQGPCAH